MSYSLYIVATPIGNLEDITLRALRILRESSLIAAEDTRKTIRLLQHFDIKTPMTSYYEHSKLTKLEYILGCLEKGDVALVSEAGTPGINDPGYDLIQAAINRNIPVVVVPGPSIVVTALTVSGLPTDRFLYLGFLPVKKNARVHFLEALVDEPSSLVFLEAPHRVNESLQDILAVLGDRRIAVCREMTKLHEEVFRGKITEAIAHFQIPRGEFALIIEGQREQAKPELTVGIAQQLAQLRNSGVTAREAIARLAKETGLNRRELYKQWLDTTDAGQQH